MRWMLVPLAVLLTASCDPKTPPRLAVNGSIELVETIPLETALDHQDIRDTSEVWLDMISKAKKTLEIEQFYISNDPRPGKGVLEPVLKAIEAAADRGVKVRILVDTEFFHKYPESVERLELRAAIKVRKLDMTAIMGGVQHAKYFIVDGNEVFLGSQNFDYRALEHIHELGIRTTDTEVARGLHTIFELDWATAESQTPPSGLGRDDTTLGYRPIMLGASPRKLLPNERMWELPKLIAWIDEAKDTVRLELPELKPTYRDGQPFPELYDALVRAARRGVRVSLLTSTWAENDVVLKDLARLPGVSVKVLTIPPWSGGPVPFARVAHAKYMIVDGVRGWLGTSNWEGDYFYRSRNVSLFIDDKAFAKQLESVWTSAFKSNYAHFVNK
ncbi:MAG: phospholipase D-like domain-containing protein [Polyangiaceae bacterium]